MTPDELRSIPLFAGASDAGLERVAATAGEMTCAAGQIVALEGDPGSGMFVIVEGTAHVEWRGGAVDLGPGTFFGELTLLAPGGTRIARVRAATEDMVRFSRQSAGPSPPLAFEPVQKPMRALAEREGTPASD